MWHPASEPKHYAPLSDVIPLAVSRSFGLFTLLDAARRPGLYSHYPGDSVTLQAQLRPGLSTVAKQSRQEQESRGAFRLLAG